MAAKASSSESEFISKSSRGEHLSLNEHGRGGWRVDPPGQRENEHSHRPDHPPGHDVGDDDEDDAVSQTLLGTDGADTLTGGAGADTLTGGAGADQFGAGAVTATVDGLDRITDFTQAEDKLSFGAEAPDPAANFYTATAVDYAAAVDAALAALKTGPGYVAVEVGSDVIVFANTDSDPTTLDGAVVLVGKTLADIDTSNFA